MILTDPNNNRLLVQAKGPISVIIESEDDRRSLWTRVRPILPILGGVALVSCIVSSLCAVLITLQIRDGMEERLVSRLDLLGAHVDAALATVGSDVQSQSEKVSAAVVQVGERVDLLPAKLDAAAHGTADAVISWLSALKKTAAPTVPLVVRANEPKRK